MRRMSKRNRPLARALKIDRADKGGTGRQRRGLLRLNAGALEFIRIETEGPRCVTAGDVEKPFESLNRSGRNGDKIESLRNFRHAELVEAFFVFHRPASSTHGPKPQRRKSDAKVPAADYSGLHVFVSSRQRRARADAMRLAFFSSSATKRRIFHGQRKKNF